MEYYVEKHDYESSDSDDEFVDELMPSFPINPVRGGRMSISEEVYFGNHDIHFKPTMYPKTEEQI